MVNFSLPTALYGGSFDPVHDGHLHVARSVMAGLPQIKQLLFVPAGRSPGKHVAFASGAQRLDWLNLAAKPEGFGVWDADLLREGESYTVDTLTEAHRLGAHRSALWWVVGADAYSGFQGWKESSRIRELCRLVVVSRPGNTLTSLHSDDLLLPIPPHPASSSALREALAGGDASSPWIPAAVLPSLEKLLPLDNPYVRKR